MEMIGGFKTEIALRRQWVTEEFRRDSEQRRFKGNNWGLQICHLDEVPSQEFSLGVIKEKKESFYTDHWGGGQNAVTFKQQVHLEKEGISNSIFVSKQKENNILFCLFSYLLLLVFYWVEPDSRPFL